MYNNIIFIGGIHGVGKGKICSEIFKKTGWIHISASEILRWKEISPLEKKEVKNIKSTQDRLRHGLNKLINPNKKYLLDGHYTLLNQEGIPELIEIDIFNHIKPVLYVLVIEEVEIIYQRLIQRDSKHYSLERLKEFQKLENNQSTFISTTQQKKLIKIKNQNLSELIKSIKDENFT